MTQILIENLNKIPLLGFAAACTAGILYPLDWIMGIRLAKEDELEGLDLTGIRYSLSHPMKKVFFLAHGESWEVAASRAVHNLVKKVLEEEGINRDKPDDNGSFELHYTPTNSCHKSITIPLSTRQTSIDCETEEQFWKKCTPITDQ